MVQAQCDCTGQVESADQRRLSGHLILRSSATTRQVALDPGSAVGAISVGAFGGTKLSGTMPSNWLGAGSDPCLSLSPVPCMVAGFKPGKEAR